MTRAARVAPVIKLMVKIGGRRGNNGRTPVDREVERKMREQIAWIPDEWSPHSACIDRRGAHRGRRARRAGGPPRPSSGLARGGSGPIVYPVSVGPSGKTGAARGSRHAYAAMRGTRDRG